MKLVQKHHWKSYYPVRCRKCLWTGSSEFVLGDEEGPFYCPYCRTSDPTDWDISTYALSSWEPEFWKDRLVYVAYRTLSLITHPWRLAMKVLWDKEFYGWIKRSEEEWEKECKNYEL